MKNLTLTYSSGRTEDLQVEGPLAQEVINAFTLQNPAFPVPRDESTVVFVNMRHVESLEVGGLDEEPEPAPEPEDTRTVAELKAALDEAKVEYPSEARKAELLELAKANNV